MESDADLSEWIVVSGDPLSGFLFYGPFESRRNAENWAVDECWKLDWWVVELEPVDEADSFVDIDDEDDDDENLDDDEEPERILVAKQKRSEIIAAESSGVGRGR